MPTIGGILETAIYVDDMARAVAFYETVLGLAPMLRGERLTAYDVGQSGVLLVFQRGGSREDIETKSGVIPGHHGEGPLHLALRSVRATLTHGADALRQTTLPSTAKWPGRPAASASTSTIRTGMSSNWRHPGSGPIIREF
jgi:catechol 2,3-dioxygenase-like lactoylglutathione lyase family enzyme